MSTINKPDRTLVSLFAGCGGSSLGYQQAGFDIRLAVEWDTKAADVYRRNFPETSIFGGDIADLAAEEALEITGLQPGALDVLDGSPPCQGFSTAGQRKFTDSRNRLFEEYVRMIDVFKPKMLVMENVSGLRKGKMKLMFAEMTIALKQAGYRVSCRELNAWWYGVPQDRRRLIWVGVREDLDMEPGHPEPTVKRAVSVREALGILYDADVQGINAKMRNPDFENKWKDGDGVGPTLMSSRPPTITGSFGHRDYLAEPENAGRWRSMDGPVATIAAMRPPSVDDGQTVRYLTIEESKVLQGFPEWFELKENEYKFVGNSVCPPMAEALGRHLLRLLEE
jgi:DNA (cytosine-5)-methyltransferase 1